MKRNISKKQLIYWIIYLFIQIPLAILAIRGIWVGDFFPKKNNERVILPNYVLKEGERELYDSTTGTEFGFVEIKFLDRDNKISVRYKSEMMSGTVKYIERDYLFEPFDISNFILEKKERKGEYYWIGESENHKMVITGFFPTKVTNNYYSNPIPLSIYKAKNHYYLCSIVTDSQYYHILNYDTRMYIGTILRLGIDESYTGGIFFF
jgi:hypothetical protein